MGVEFTYTTVPASSLLQRVSGNLNIEIRIAVEFLKILLWLRTTVTFATHNWSVVRRGFVTQKKLCVIVQV